MTDDQQELPPHNLEAEMAVLGAAFWGESSDNALTLHDHLFYDGRHRVIAGAIRSVAEMGTIPELISVKEALECQGKLAEAGEWEHLLQCAQAAPNQHNFDHWKGILQKLSERRVLIQIGARIQIGAMESLDIGLSQLGCGIQEWEERANGTLKEPPPYTGKPWPEQMDRAAYHGLTGRIVDRILPHSEADPAALGSSFLMAFGNCIGRTGYWQAEDTHHYTNENAVIVGRSSIARKGTSQDRIMALFGRADAFWAKKRTASGLVSGEGLIHSIRDANPNGKDDGVPDKRLFVTEGEFAQVLSSAGRKDSTLSVVIRNAWDGKTLRTLARNGGKGGDTATDPHVSILAHITLDELKEKLNACDSANGFANRFFWICSERSKLLPMGGSLRIADCVDLVDDLSSALVHAKDRGQVHFTPEAEEFWVSIYPALNKERTGPIASVISRGPAHIRRLALIYALIDHAQAVHAPHLQAAFAVWNYSVASAEFIFGTVDPKTSEIHERLRKVFPGELDRTAIHQITHRNSTSSELTSSLNSLLEAGYVSCRTVRTKGASKQLWKACLKPHLKRA